MAEILLKTETRKDVGKNLDNIRKKGQAPGVLYGSKTKSTPLVLDGLALQKAYDAAGENTIIYLELNGKKIGVLIKAVQRHPVTDRIIHVDFYEIDMTKIITAYVPLNFYGESKAVKEGGGTLVTSIDEIEVECLPADLPKEIDVDISTLETFDDVVNIGNIHIPENVKSLFDKKRVVATVSPPRSEEELKELEEEVKEEVEEVEGVEKEEPELEATEQEAEAAPEKKDKKPEEGGKAPAKEGDSK